MEKDYLTLFISLASPLLVAIGGLVTWFFKSRKEELLTIEERALEKRIEIYNQILDPIIIILSNKADKKTKDKALLNTGSIDYRKAGFNLMTFGSDVLVKSYNEMMQAFFKDEAETNPKATMKKFANFILAIRKDLYNKNTKLEEWDMLKFMITDIDKLIK